MHRSIKSSKSRLALSYLFFTFLLTINISSKPISIVKEIKFPNILLLVADDLGYADIGCYGGDIQTPNIDGLAERGIRFSRFHASPYCAPSRAMLLSGNDNHIAGMGSQSLVTDEFGYEGKLSDRIVTIPQILRNAGYQTYMAGKWHLGLKPEDNPHQKGFDRSFVNLHGVGNHYDDQGWTEEYPKTLYTENGKPTPWKKGRYSTDLYTDKIIQYIDQYKEVNKPFFAFAAFTAPHWPLQVDEKYWKKYKGKYDAGYDKLKSERLESLKKTGMIPESAQLPENHPSVKPWDSLTLNQKKIEARKMELYAGMVDNLDYNIGRLIDYLKDIGEYDNTIIVFMSDNGAAAEDFYTDDHFGPFLTDHFNNDYENMGKPDSFISYGPQWAEAGSSPFRYFKGFTTEGGMNAPMIICGPQIKPQEEINDSFITLMDLAPTFYDIAQATYPKKFLGKETYPLKGASITSIFNGDSKKLHGPDYIFGFEHRNYALLRKGKWKITNIEKPFDLENFKLYDLSTDLAEKTDLKNIYPDKYDELLNEWKHFSQEIKVQVPTPKSNP